MLNHWGDPKEITLEEFEKEFNHKLPNRCNEIALHDLKECLLSIDEEE